jgi:CHASE2 domain-containing sensor protein
LYSEKYLNLFIDEIDTTLALKFTDDFFVGIRSLYQKRAQTSKLKRLSFVLVGVATPSDLIKNTKRTPFNIGQRVDLTDFTYEEALPLAQGLGVDKSQEEHVLQWILQWTNGHPFLTQLGCQAIEQRSQPSWTKAQVDDVMVRVFLSGWNEKSDHLRSVQRILLEGSPNVYASLTTYKKIINQEKDIFDDERSPILSHLKLAGVVRRQPDGSLKESNEVYRRIFDNAWVDKKLSKPLLPIQRLVFPSLLIPFLIFSLRQLGLLQPLELATYDHLMRQRPAETPDSRILIVGITDVDVAQVGGFPVADQTLAALIKKLQSNRPAAIGVNIFRSQPVKQGQAELAQVFQGSEEVFGIEMFGVSGNDQTQPPSSLPAERVGFVNLIPDFDGYVRRSLMVTTDQNDVGFSFPLKLAATYLAKQGLVMENGIQDADALRFGKTEILRFRANFGGYVGSDDGGVQTMLSFRSGKNPFPTMSLNDIMTGKADPSLIRDRVVLIGMISNESSSNNLLTPYSDLPSERMPPVILQAHATSQILSAVLEGRSLIWVIPRWTEALWIFAWAFLGTVVVWRIGSWQVAGLVIFVLGGILYVTCLLLLSAKGLWIPLAPPAIAFILTSSSTRILIYNFKNT